MRVITKDYQSMLSKSLAYNFIKNTPKPDYTELNKLSKEFEDWISKEHEKDRQLLKAAAKNDC